MLTLKEMKSVAKELSFTWKKKMGQNFLFDPNVLRYILNLAIAYSAETVFEVGAGMGNLTELLSESFRRVVAVEIDEKLCKYLEDRFYSKDRIHIICADVMKLRLEEVLGKGSLCVSNIPYYISTPLIIKLLKHRTLFTSIILMVQKEIADRLLASPSTKEYGPLSIYTQLTATVKRLKTVSPHSFYPEPDVNSVIVELSPRISSNIDSFDEDAFLSFLKIAFSHRRKTLFNNIKKKLPGKNRDKIEAIFDALRIEPDSRAETVSPDVWVELFKRLLSTNFVF